MERALTLTASGVLLATLFVPTAAPAESSTGISGTVFDAATNQPLTAVAVALEREDGSSESVNVFSSKRGFYVRLGLQPGRYAVSAHVAGRTAACSIADVFEGQMRRVDVVIGGRTGRCVQCREAVRKSRRSG